jgi:acetolactate synthase small subunit
VGETENPDVSRITIVVNADSSPLEQVTKQLNKLVNVLKIVELDPQQSVQRELCWSRCAPTVRSEPGASRRSSCSGRR